MIFEKSLAVVFDCNVFVQMFLNPHGSASRCYDLVKTGAIELFVTRGILAEVAEVLSRPRFKVLVPDLTSELIEDFLTEIAEMAIEIKNVSEEFKYPRDPDDEIYLNLAIAARADFLISLDNDLLDLTNKSSKESVDFQRRYPMLKIITPYRLLSEVDAESEANM